MCLLTKNTFARWNFLLLLVSVNLVRICSNIHTTGTDKLGLFVLSLIVSVESRWRVATVITQSELHSLEQPTMWTMFNTFCANLDDMQLLSHCTILSAVPTHVSVATHTFTKICTHTCDQFISDFSRRSYLHPAAHWQNSIAFIHTNTSNQFNAVKVTEIDT